jgi:hypothetical protein
MSLVLFLKGAEVLQILLRLQKVSGETLRSADCLKNGRL